MFYTHGNLDRADHLRKDAAALATMQAAPESFWIPVWNGNMPIASNHNGEPELLCVTDGAALQALAGIDVAYSIEQQTADEPTPIFLGLIDESPVFALSISHVDESKLDSVLTLALNDNDTLLNPSFADLRLLGPLLPANDGALMAYAKSLVYWQDSCRYCSRCGNSLVSTNGGHVKICTAAEHQVLDGNTCGYMSFPRTDPAVIMLVVRDADQNGDKQCLLGRNANWPSGVFSTLAGFVEPGESLEQAVQREVLEESGIGTRDVRYIASQPWPFPRSIMLGFEATATTFDIVCDPTEIEDARWFTREQLKTFGTWGDSDYEFQLPRTDSIARMLIDRWINDSAI